MKPRTKLAIGIAIGLIAIIQLVPISRTNPPVEDEIPVSEAVRDVLRQSCYDCHSNETHWPWYARVAPASWLVASDVHEARHDMNFSTWNLYDEEERADHLDEIWEHVDDKEMPPWTYLLMHRDARLTPEDIAVIRAWVGPGTAEDSVAPQP